MNEWLGWFTPWWHDLASFLRMGKHGSYVWASVALSVTALGLEWGLLRRRSRLNQMMQEGLESDR